MIDYSSKEELSILYSQKESGDSYVSFRIDLLEITLKHQVLIKPLQVFFPGKEIIHSNIMISRKGGVLLSDLHKEIFLKYAGVLLPVRFLPHWVIL